VLDRVRQRLLRDAVDGQAGGGGQAARVALDGERDVGARRLEPLHQRGQLIGAGQRRGAAAVSLRAQHPHRQPHLVQALPAQPLGLGQRPRLGHLVRHQQHRGAALVQLAHRVPHAAAGGRVEALGQLVEDHQAGPVEQREHQEQALPLSPAERGERRPAPLRQPEPPEQLTAVLRPQGGEQLDRLGHPEPVRQRGVLQLAADERPQLRGLGDGVVAQHAKAAGVRPAEPLDALDCGRLPGTVRARQADDLAGADIEVQAVHDDPGPVRFAQTADGHGG